MEYKVFIMEILNDLYLIREDVKEGPGYDAITALIKKIESRSMENIELGREDAKQTIMPNRAHKSSNTELNISQTDLDGVFIYQFKK